MIPGCPPILSCEAAGVFEAERFGGDETREWPAMRQAGRALAEAVLADSEELGGFPPDGRILVIAGKGHNAGDALIAARALLERFPLASADVLFVLGERRLRPLVQRAWRDLAEARVRVVTPGSLCGPYALSLDGLFGFRFRPPVPEEIAVVIERVNRLPIALRAAVDLPSAGSLRADFTYATGIVKTPALEPVAGRVRWLDLGFFAAEGAALPVEPARPANARVLRLALLRPLAALRAPQSDKRSFGHVFVLGGSRGYPGAVLLAVLAALRSGAGLVTAFVPESLVAAFAARAPEAMWVGWPETPEGSLALEGRHLLVNRLDRADALLLGPGLGREPETLALVRDLVNTSSVPLVLDADALQPEIVKAGAAPRILTPHAGELARIAPGLSRRDAATALRATLVAKGPSTRVLGPGDAVEYCSFFGGPVLARGGSGDVLAGLAGGLLAQTPEAPTLAAARAVVWHGFAADLLARAHGQTSVQTTQLLDFLSPALRAADRTGCF